MPKFLICFHVEQTLSGSIEIEAESAQEARELFEHPDPFFVAEAMEVDDARRAATLHLEDSHDTITRIQPITP